MKYLFAVVVSLALGIFAEHNLNVVDSVRGTSSNCCCTKQCPCEAKQGNCTCCEACPR